MKNLQFTICKFIGDERRILNTASFAVGVSLLFAPLSSRAFEGRINATFAHRGETNTLIYTVGTNFLRVEMSVTNSLNPVDILDRNSGMLTLLFPHNRSFVRLQPASTNLASPFPGMPAMPLRPGGLPPGIGPQAQSANPPGVPTMPTMPNMPGRMPAMPDMAMMMERVELKATGEKTNLLGFACERYELTQRGETAEIWATEQLFPYQPYLRNQPPRFGPRTIDEQWPELLRARKLFPLLVTLKSDHGPERFRFEVNSITPGKIADRAGKLFQPPDGYLEIQPLPN